jgi:hypothetical protein
MYTPFLALRVLLLSLFVCSKVRRLISEGASPDYMNRNGRTALMAAGKAKGNTRMITSQCFP